jgi:hypothetical protein
MRVLTDGDRAAQQGRQEARARRWKSDTNRPVAFGTALDTAEHDSFCRLPSRRPSLRRTGAIRHRFEPGLRVHVVSGCKQISAVMLADQ